MRKILLINVPFILLIAFVLIQLVPVERTNPPVVSDIKTSPEVKSVLKRACYDCHSNETVWPWYSRVAPVSWLVAHDVNEGREYLNFSRWDEYSVKQKVELIKESLEEAEEGEMPPWVYIPAHPDALLSIEDIQVLRKWAAVSSIKRNDIEDYDNFDEDKYEDD